MKVDNTENSLKSFLSFRMMDEIFAIDVLHVMEILELTKITKVPRSPEFLLGIVNLRGNVLPVIDARIKFGMPKKEPTIDSCIIVMSIEVDAEPVTIGALVDSVSAVLEIRPNDIQKSPSIGLRYSSDFVNGLVKIDDDFVMILNIGKAFSQEDLGLLTTISEDAEQQVH